MSAPRTSLTHRTLAGILWAAYGKVASTSEAEFEIPLFTVRFTSLVPVPRSNGPTRGFEQAIVPVAADQDG